MKILLGLAVLAALTVAAPDAFARDDDDRTFDSAILDVLLERGLIDEATYAELIQLAGAQRAEQRETDLLKDQLQRLRAPDVATSGGKSGKLKWESEDGKWSLGIKGRIQAQFDAVRGENGNRKADVNNFGLRRGRLAFSGKAGGDDLTYKFEIDAPTSDKVNSGAKKDFSVTDMWLNWGLNDGLDFKWGQYKFPFGREVHLSSSSLNLVNESIATKEFAPDREPGAMLYGATEDSIVEWYLGVSNGQGTGVANESGTGSASGATGMRTGARVVVNPMGKLDKSASALQTVNDGGVLVSLGASYMRNSDQNVDVNGNKLADPADARSNDDTMGLDAQVFAGPFSLLAEHFSRTMDVDQGLPDVDDKGLNLQAGVFVVDDVIELVLRRTELDYDVSDDLQETTLGVVYYVDKHNSKFTFDVSDIKNKDTPKKDATQVRAQYQLVF